LSLLGEISHTYDNETRIEGRRLKSFAQGSQRC
jgi:hypothetical protein